jgi:methyltransferase (TIGR00027 family)
MAQTAAKTGAGPTAIVAAEQYFPHNQRIIADDFAYRLLPPGARTFVCVMRLNFLRNRIIQMTEKIFPGLWSAMLCRKRYIDEKLIASVGQIDAVVNLGAGFDTRAYRLPTLTDLPVWEVDQPENIESKRAALRKLFGGVPAHITLVPIDFDRQELGSVLESYGFSLDKRAFFIREAVAQYLTETRIRASCEFLAKAARGSRLALTYVRKDFLDGQKMYDQKSLYKRYVVNKIWLFGMEPEHMAFFLQTYGWRVIEHLGYEELHERYLKPTRRQLGVMHIERIVYAEKL